MSHSLFDCFNRFIDYLKTYLDHSTEVTTHRCAFRHFAQVVPVVMSVRRLTAQHLRQFRDHLVRQGLSRKTIREYLHRTIRWISYCWEVGLITQETFLACKNMWRPNPRQGRPTIKPVPVTSQDLLEILPHCPEDLANLLTLHWLTAARPGEIVQLNEHDLEPVSEGQTLWHLKNHKGHWRGEERTLFLGRSGLAVLATIEAGPGGFLFPSKKNSLGFLTRLTYQKQLKRLQWNLIKNGIIEHFSGWTTRGIRAGRARQIQRLYGLEAARVLLGHSHQSMTARYVGVSAPPDSLLLALRN